jgi:hypothetical protein
MLDRTAPKLPVTDEFGDVEELRLLAQKMMAGPIEEVNLTVQDRMLAALDIARRDLERNCIDGLHRLVKDCWTFPQDQWPPEVVEFVRYNFVRGRKGHYRFKRKRGRMISYRTSFLMWQRDPNRVAAWRYMGLKGKPRERLARAIETVNAWPNFGDRKAEPGVVRKLVRRGLKRYWRPVDPFEDPYNEER